MGTGWFVPLGNIPAKQQSRAVIANPQAIPNVSPTIRQPGSTHRSHSLHATARYATF